MSEDIEYAQRHCMLQIVRAGEGTSESAMLWYLDWLDEQGAQHTQQFSSEGEAFDFLGNDGWKLVQVIEHAASAGVFDGPIPANICYYFNRPARSKG